MAELTRRYIVMPMSVEGPFDPLDPDASFVLKPWKDPAALAALEAYRASCYPELARDIARVGSGHPLGPDDPRLGWGAQRELPGFAAARGHGPEAREAES